MLDVLISIGIFIATVAMGYMGVHVTLHPPRNRSRFKRWFLLLSIWASVLAVVQGIRNKKAQDQLVELLNKIEANTEHPATINVQNREPAIISMSYVKAVHPMTAGADCIFNVYFKNVGTGETIGNGQDGANAYLSKKLVTEDEQKALVAKFDKWWSNNASHVYRFNPQQPNTESFVTSQGPVLDSESVSSLKSGEKVVYILGRVTFSDKYGSYTQSYCWYTEPPQDTIIGPQVVFHNCSFGNEKRAGINPR